MNRQEKKRAAVGGPVRVIHRQNDGMGTAAALPFLPRSVIL
ncbi:MAG: hypothetical protein PUE78_02835 [Clostridia bacterium]|nr:hypothetical protein [Clostridia bacterium]